ncbi:MAG: biotin attachment protein, partial [bacterium (Candidatus Ratteibacteria) CG01_land_8_20_14_3_00_40_19]
APEKGNLSKIFFQVGEKVKVGETIATIETE